MRPRNLKWALALLVTGCCTNCGDKTPQAVESRKDPTPLSTNALLWNMRDGDLARSFQMYQVRARGPLGHDFVLLRHMATLALEQGISSNDPESQFLCVAGAQLGLTEETQRVLEVASTSRYPQVQLAAMHALAQSGDKEAGAAIARAMGSRYLALRMHAAYLLSQLQRDEALDQINALMHKAPPELTLYYPLLLGQMEGPEATAQLRRLMHGESAETAANAISIAARGNRDDLLADIQQLSTRLDPVRQEVAADALGRLGDSTSIGQLEKLAESSAVHVRLAALHALLRLHKTGAAERLLETASRDRDIFAIASLADVESAGGVLRELLDDRDQHVRANAAIALLHLRDPEALPVIADLLIQDARDLALTASRSPGGVFRAWRIVPSSHEQFRKDPASLAESVAFREHLLTEASQLPQADFLAFANLVLISNQRSLVPHTMALIEKLGTPQATRLLQEIQQTPGQPLLRMYAALALYRLGVPGSAGSELQAWVSDVRNHELIQFRPARQMDERHPEPYQELTPVETSRLLIEACMTLTEKQQNEGIDTLLTLIAEGNPQNRYALMGLLIRATL